MSVGSRPDSLSSSFSRAGLWRWGAAAALVTAVHAGGLWYSQQFHVAVAPPAPPPSMVMIDLAPMVVAAEAVPTDQADVIESQASETVKETIEPVEEEKPVEEVTEVEEPKPVEEIVEPEVAEEVIPDIQEAPKPEVVIQKPVEKPKPVKKKAEPIKKPIEKKVVEKPKPEKKPAKKSASAPSARKGAEKAEKAAAPVFSRSAGNTMSPAQWESKVNAHMQRRNRRGSARGPGSVNIRFSVNATGAVTGVSVARSSGKPELDQAAVRLVQGASPVPAPPDGARRTLVIPISFKR